MIFIPLFLDFSGGEFLLIGVVFLMFFGSKSIPGIARTMGKIIREFKDAAGSVQREIQESANVNLKDFDLNRHVDNSTGQSGAAQPPNTVTSLPQPPKAEPSQPDKNTKAEKQPNA